MAVKLSCRLAVLIDEHNARVAKSGNPERRLNQRKLAALLGVSTATVGRLYNNNFDRVDVRTVEKICSFFKCDVGDLFVTSRNDWRVAAHNEVACVPTLSEAG